MPIPKPNKGEKQDAFMGRCMEVMKGENRPQRQKVAICMGQFKRKKKK